MKKEKRKPVIGITMGDPAGIGPEVIVKALSDGKLHAGMTTVLIGDGNVMERANALLNYPVGFREIGAQELSDRTLLSSPDVIPFLDLRLIDDVPPFGEQSAIAGNVAFRCIQEAVRLGMSGFIDAICTAPIHKEALHKAGHMYPGHTEILADLMGADKVAMMLTAPNLRVIHVTTHVGLIDAIAKITPERVYQVIALGHELLRRSGMTQPRIAVCGINPHAGEGGLFGYGEEEEKIQPAIIRARAEGMEVSGPLPADTLFYRATRGHFDLIVAMYHDQGHGPVKVLGLEAGVNISVGLPVIRTSVDHGTAFDIAGQGIADERSMLEALSQAAQLVPQSAGRESWA
jgi:4-hydroxythreonine-4-phosphate dehydrogenase